MATLFRKIIGDFYVTFRARATQDPASFTSSGVVTRYIIKY